MKLKIAKIRGIESFGYRTFLWEQIWDLFKQKPKAEEYGIKSATSLCTYKR